MGLVEAHAEWGLVGWEGCHTTDVEYCSHIGSHGPERGSFVEDRSTAAGGKDRNQAALVGVRSELTPSAHPPLLASASELASMG